MKKAVLALSIVLGMSAVGSAQNVEIEGLVEEDINTSLEQDGVNFQTDYLNKTVPYKDVFVPEQYHPYLADFDVNYKNTKNNGNGQGGNQKFSIDFSFQDVDNSSLPNKLDGYTYTADFKDTGSINGGQTSLTVQSSVKQVSGNPIQEDADYDLKITGNNERAQVDGSLNRVNGSTQIVNDGSLDFNASAETFAFDSGVIKPRVSSHYEHLIVRHEVRSSVSPDYGKTLETTENVYSGNDTARIPVSGEVNQLSAGKVNLESTRDGLYEEKETKKYVIAHSPRTNISNIDFKGMEHTKIGTVDYSELVEPELDNAGISSGRIENPSNYEFTAYNVTFPSDSVKTIETNFTQPVYNPLTDNPENFNFEYYSYIVGSVATFKTDTSSEWSNGVFTDTLDDAGVLKVRGKSIEVPYLDTSDNLKYYGKFDGSQDLGIDSNNIGGTGDVDADGLPEVSVGSVDFVDVNSEVQSASIDNYYLGGTYDMDSDGKQEVLYEYTSGDEYRYVGASGTKTTVGSGYDQGTPADFDNDGAFEVGYIPNYGSSITLIDSSGSSDGFLEINSGFGEMGGVCDVDGDGKPALFADNNGLVYGDKDTKFSNLESISVADVGGAADINQDGLCEVAIVQNNALKIIDTNSNIRTLISQGVENAGFFGDLNGKRNSDGKGSYDSKTYSASEKKIWDNVTVSSFAKNGGTIDITVETSNDGFSTTLESETVSSSQLSSSGTETVDLSLSSGATDVRYSVSLSKGSSSPSINSISLDGKTANQPPTASFSSNSPVLTDNDLGLDASGSSDPDGDALSYAWDFFNDGTTDASGVSPSKSFAEDQTLDVALTVSDGNGASDTVVKQVTIENRNPEAIISASKNDKELTLDASGSSDPDGSISTVEYDWTDDGTYEDSGTTASHVYSSGGTKTVTVKVTDDDGATDSTTQNIDINQDPSLGSFSLSKNSIQVGETVKGIAVASDPDGDSMNDIRFSARHNGNTVYSNRSGNYVGGGEWESPEVEAQYANSDIVITVENITDSSSASVYPGVSRSVSVENTAPSISNQRFNKSAPEYKDEVVFKADVTDIEYGVSEVLVTVQEGGNTILDNVSATSGAGSTFISPSFTVDEVETEYNATVSYAEDQNGKSTTASAQGAVNPSISTGNSPPTINSLGFNASSPEYGDLVRLEANISDAEVGVDSSTLELNVFNGSDRIQSGNGTLQNGLFISDPFRVTDIETNYTGEVGFVEDLEGFTTSSDIQNVNTQELSVDRIKPSNRDNVEVLSFTSSSRDKQVIGENATIDVGFKVENLNSYSVDLDLSGQTDTCSLESNGLGSVGADSTSVVDEVLNCKVGSVEPAFLEVFKNEPTSDFNTVNYSTVLDIESNFTRNDPITWEINSTNLNSWSDREFGTEKVISKDNNTEVNFISSTQAVEAVFKPESLSKGSTDATLSYYFAQEADTSGGGGGGAPTVIENDDSETEDNTSSVLIEQVGAGFRQDSGLIEHEISPDSVSKKQIKLSNLETRENQIRLSVPSDGNEFCRYVDVQEQVGVEEYGDRAVVDLPPSNEDGERFLSVRYSIPKISDLEAEGIQDYTCGLETSSSLGSAGDAKLEPEISSSALSGISLEGLWGKEYCVGGNSQSLSGLTGNSTESSGGSCGGNRIEGPTQAGASVLFVLFILGIGYFFIRTE